MKLRKIAVLAAMCCAVAGWAKDIRTVVFKTSPEMHCNGCETKIKNNIRFEKGIKDIQTNLEDKTVTVKYDADKTTVENIIRGFAKIGYEATVDTSGQEAEADAVSSASSRTE